MNFKALESEQKLLGAYYTPAALADFLVNWVMEIEPRQILEPSCGDGVFLSSLEHFIIKSRRKIAPPIVEAIDIDEKAGLRLARRVKAGDFPHLKARVQTGDFLQYSLVRSPNEPMFDAVLGNPPFIRYQYVEPNSQALTERIFGLSGLPFTKHTNAWVPFVIQGLRLLRPGGRLAMVIPAEIMHVLHAKPLRDYIISTCSTVRVAHVEDLFSEGVLQGIVLLLCEKRKASCSQPVDISFPELRLADLVDDGGARVLGSAESKNPNQLGRKWMKGLLSKREYAIFKRATELPAVVKFADAADVDVGIVTGANSFFLVPDETVRKFDLQRFSEPMFGRSNHVRGLTFSQRDHSDNAKEGLPSNFLQFPELPLDQLPRKVQEYIRIGEAQGLHKRYKCRIREPWYCVPSVWVSKISMLKRAHTMSRLILNQAGAYTTDTAYRIQMRGSFVGRDRDFVACFINSLTALSAEVEGRHYGGGVIELVPSEIERLVVPLIKGAAAERMDAVDRAIRRGEKMTAIIREQDNYILREAGLSESEVDTLHRAWLRLLKRRLRTS